MMKSLVTYREKPMYRFRTTPLEKMRLTQPFGVDYTGGGIPLGDGKYGGYKDLGLAGHNGWDVSAITGTQILAVADGNVSALTDGGYGVNARLITQVDLNTKLEVVYGHLREITKTGEVAAGDIIGYSNNTGFSTAPHLHFGTRPLVRRPGTDIFDVKDYANGFFGYVDPAQFYPLTVFDLPVDKKYGMKRFVSEIAFYPSQVFFYRKFKRLMTTREYNAFVYGAWDIRTVLDPAMAEVWWNFTKIEARAKGIIA